MFFQFTAASTESANTFSSSLSDPVFIAVFFVIAAGIVLAAGIFIARAFFHTSTRAEKAFHRVVLQILVPKERKSEGQTGQVGQEDRLEQVKEEIGITETLFSAIAGLRAQRGFSMWLRGRTDHVAFEIVAKGGLIFFYLDIPIKMRQFVEQQIHAQYPHAEIEEMTDYNIFTPNSAIIGAYLGPKQKHFFPIKTYKEMESDPLNAVLNVFSRVQEPDTALAVQYVVRSAHKKWRGAGVRVVREIRKGKKFEDVVSQTGLQKFFSAFNKTAKAGLQTKEEKEKTEHYQLSSMEEEMLKGIEKKLTKGGMDVTIRLLSVSNDETIARMHLDNVISAYSQYNLYHFGNSFEAAIPRKQTALIQDFIYRTFHEKRFLVLNTEEMASVWHLPLHSTEAPNIKWLTGRKAPPPQNMPKEGLHLGYVLYRGVRTETFIKPVDRRRHMYIIGKSGTGKSVTLANMAIQDIQAGHGVCIVDPHGDLVEDILAHVPKHRADDVIVFDPSDMERPIGLNMLEAKTEDQKDFAVQEMIAIFYKLFPPEMIGPMFEHNMRNVMLTLMADTEHPGTIIDIPRMFTDDAYVNVYLKKLKDPIVRAFWEKEMAKTSDFHKSEMLGYLISKVGRFVENEMMRNIMGQQKSGFDFREVMDKKKILFVNLAKGKTGEVNAKLLGLIIVAKLQMAAMGRADVSEEERHDFYLYIDEFQNFITDSIATILSEARKYRLDLILAHQYMGQLTDEKGKSDVRDAVLGNVGTMLIGRIGPDDADVLAKEFAPVFGPYDLLNPPEYSFYTKLLIDNKPSRPFNMNAYPPAKGNRDIAQALKQLSRLTYGRPRDMVEHEVLERTKLGSAEGKSKTEMLEPSL